MTKIKEKYQKEVVAKLKEALQKENIMQIPKLSKVTINVGLSTKRDPNFIETMVDTLTKISGQKPVITKARKSIAGFKIREDQPLGVKVTLRGERMWDFIDKLAHVTFARIRDFRGIKRSTVDAGGNFSYGFTEHIAFPEVEADAIDQLHGLQVTITTTAEDRASGMALFQALGFPFKKEEK